MSKMPLLHFSNVQSFRKKSRNFSLLNCYTLLDEKSLREKLYRNQTPTTKFEMIGREIFAGSVDHHLQRNLISKVWLLGFNLIITERSNFKEKSIKASFTLEVNLGFCFFSPRVFLRFFSRLFSNFQKLSSKFQFSFKMYCF